MPHYAVLPYDFTMETRKSLCYTTKCVVILQRVEPAIHVDRDGLECFCKSISNQLLTVMVSFAILRQAGRIRLPFLAFFFS